MKKRRTILFLLLVCSLLGLSIRTVVVSAGTQKEPLEKTKSSFAEGVVMEAIAEPTMVPERLADKEDANRTSDEVETLEILPMIYLGKISEEEYPMKFVEAFLDRPGWTDEAGKEIIKNKLLEIIKQMEE